MRFLFLRVNTKDHNYWSPSQEQISFTKELPNGPLRCRYTVSLTQQNQRYYGTTAHLLMSHTGFCPVCKVQSDT